ncbi:MAG: hypothetical protein RMZ41_011370 [Nostoc sp. DedVER02]|uniref:hypothetical protein n=1 Tax=unclassified Nostoc TaxID=2593658 RepID=UPI002AD4AE67|nr:MULTISPECIES: hypothetical protein [unclassified Nostoc]MDZ7989760.1 hypothetical protein [Nostoc sp. DedVER02]MDZ8113314.1 hypothetical protein [Nostoc sp. DedVER01b]
MNVDTNILPIINLESISQILLANIPQDDLLAQLVILKGQFILVEHEGKKSKYKFLSPEAVEKAFTSKTATSGWLSSNTIWWGKNPEGEAIIQFYSPQKYQIQIMGQETKVITIPMPAFLFAGCGSRYYLWAVKGRVFKPDAQLYKPPLPNVWDDSSICFGGNSPGTCSAATISQTWELFWKSPFNKDLSQGKSKTYPDNICNQLIKLHESKPKSYPSSDLVSVHSWKVTTPEDIIHHLFS